MMVDAQQGPVFTGNVNKAAQLPVIAVPDFRGAGAAESYMGVFNQTLWSDLQGSGMLKLAPKTLYPKGIPQQPSDFRQPPPVTVAPRSRHGEMVAAPKMPKFNHRASEQDKSLRHRIFAQAATAL